MRYPAFSDTIYPYLGNKSRWHVAALTYRFRSVATAIRTAPKRTLFRFPG